MEHGQKERTRTLIGQVEKGLWGEREVGNRYPWPKKVRSDEQCTWTFVFL